jgi:hypothetical protein
LSDKITELLGVLLGESLARVLLKDILLFEGAGDWKRVEMASWLEGKTVA